jgi:hypothetical protein
MTTTDIPTPEQHVALVDALIPFARATLGQDAHPHDIAYHCWVTLEQGYPITGVDMALVTKATTAFLDNTPKCGVCGKLVTDGSHPGCYTINQPQEG